MSLAGQHRLQIDSMATVAPQETDLPTVAEIEASPDVLSIPTNDIKVVRARERFAVKIGNRIPSQEAENMKFVAQNSNVPVPKVYDHFFDLETQKRYIIMDYIPGADLEKAYHRSRQRRKRQSANGLEPYLMNYGISQIRGTLETWGASLISTNQEQMNQGILATLSVRDSPQYVRLLRGMIARTLKDHKIVFTHGDLQPKNIMVERNGLQEDGNSDFKITLIDWNLSGWYPECWDFCNSTVHCQLKPGWLELIPDIMDEYTLEYLMMRVVYSSVFY
ncbi:Aminoglycoside phosphotransferase [Penicillium canariense]|uniref:Aminoglycoside phosphotransferase n=1 Tax=Penicillium canariense TaxID=189055 RepID=A0A9W9HSI9_9EURO|nr:Aminoglycoside phosphotransferase [Penicillium canariense]KAJ5152684.1 Aminoglycoside phosphotransferase [Penicillium canariense]